MGYSSAVAVLCFTSPWVSPRALPKDKAKIEHNYMLQKEAKMPVSNKFKLISL